MVEVKNEESAPVRQAEKIGMTVRKAENFSEWYTQVVQKAELADYSSGKGFIVIRPNGYDIWENVRKFFDSEIKKTGHRNAYFPTLIPESLLKKESEHFTGFVPEVFWVTKSGNNELADPYAVRPTSETVIHDSMRNWIRSWRDLPLLLNVWNSVLRAEIKSTKPFIRTSEFLWQEGHTAHSNEKEAEEEVMQILRLYIRLLEELLAIPVIAGRKSDKEKFVGAVYTTTLESMMPDGRALQMATSHHLGQNFSKPFEIRFLGEDGEMHHVWHTSWGISWRILGALIMIHGDDKGLVLPPRIAETQVVIIPIIFSSSAEDSGRVLGKCQEIQNSLIGAGIRAIIDSRENYRPGWKFNDWELKGIPLRIEIGPRDISSNSMVMARRDMKAKESVSVGNVVDTVRTTLSSIQESLWGKANELLNSMTKEATNLEELDQIMERGGFAKSFWCGSRDCEEKIKNRNGSDIRAIPFEQPKDIERSRCVYCNGEAKYLVYFARAY